MSESMSVWTSNDFSGRWPVGASAVVVASTQEEALFMLSAELKARGLKFDGTLVKLPLDKLTCVILQDGEY